MQDKSYVLTIHTDSFVRENDKAKNDLAEQRMTNTKRCVLNKANLIPTQPELPRLRIVQYNGKPALIHLFVFSLQRKWTAGVSSSYEKMLPLVSTLGSVSVSGQMFRS